MRIFILIYTPNDVWRSCILFFLPQFLYFADENLINTPISYRQRQKLFIMIQMVCPQISKVVTLSVTISGCVSINGVRAATWKSKWAWLRRILVSLFFPQEMYISNNARSTKSNFNVLLFRTLSHSSAQLSSVRM